MHYWQLLRPQQWIKNAFVWAGFLFARAWHDIALAQQVALAFIAFCLLASAVYIGNDWLDRDADRAHPIKRDRPLASGRIGGAAAGSLAVVLALAGLAIGAWVGGFDVLYACQDVDFDRSVQLYSVPKRFGVAGALWIARGMHVVMIGLLIWLALSFALLWPAWIGIAVVATLLGYEHSLVHANDLRRLNAAFFTVNGYISLLFLLFWGAAIAAAG